MSKSDKVWDADLLGAPHKASDKAHRVRSMFNAIAPRYELVNSVFSAGRDGYWRQKAVALAKVRKDDDVLDVACGTGDFSRVFAAAKPRSVIGCDFAHEMLVRAVSREGPRIEWCEADALRLPFDNGSFSIVSCAFGIRNLQKLEAGLREFHRILRPGGRAVVLEFSRPRRGIMRTLYEFYANRLMPFGATMLSGDRTGAYRYLPRSVVSFPDTSRLVEMFLESGFSTCNATVLTTGVVTVYVATREL